MAMKTKRVHLLWLLLASFHVRIGYAAFTPNQADNSGGNNQGSGGQTFPDQGGDTVLNNPGSEGGNPGEQQTNPNTRSILPADCGTRKSNGIIGAEMTVFGEFPWMAIIEYLDNTTAVRPTCGGVLISQRYVLTAAHCIKRIPTNWKVKSVRLREHNMTDIDEPFISVGYERIIVHEEYNKPAPHRNDIALIRLDRNVKLTPYVRPICLPSSDDNGQTYVLAGWGLRVTRYKFEVMVKGPLKLYDIGQCAERYTEDEIILGVGQMCAGGAVAKDTCHGDIGGPLIKSAPQNGKLRWFVHGIGSVAYVTCSWLLKLPQVYTKVIDYVPWIKKNIRA